MSDWFSRAAVDRIAECVAVESQGTEPSPASSLLRRYVESAPLHGIGDKDFPEPDPLLGDLISETAVEFHAFASLLELAVQTGYVDLGAWDDLQMLGSALTSFIEREAASDKPTDVTLLQALVTRLERHELRVAGRDDRVFYAFASLVHLTACVGQDLEARAFLRASRIWSPGDDLPFLLTARHFAEARVRGTVGDVEAKSLVAGLAVLRYLEWLAEILHRVEHVPGLPEAFVRQARWAHVVPAVSQRLDIWARRMSEWADSGVDGEGEAVWRTFRSMVLAPLAVHVLRVRPQEAVTRKPREIRSICVRRGSQSGDVLVARLARLLGRAPTLSPLGSSGSTFALTIDGRVRAVAKRVVDAARVPDLDRLLTLVRGKGLPCPSVLGGVEVEGTWYAVFSHLAGRELALGSCDWEPAWERAFEWLVQLGAIVEPPLSRDLEDHWLDLVDESARIDAACCAVQRVLRAAPPSGPRTLVHGDFAPQNFLLGADGLALVDWEEAGRARPGFDAGWLLALNRVGAGARMHRSVLFGRLAALGLAPPNLRWFEGLGLLRMHARALAWREAPARKTAVLGTAVLGTVRHAARSYLAEHDPAVPLPETP
jgi:hypothetical protein